jgi:hypothetical protein
MNSNRKFTRVTDTRAHREDLYIKNISNNRRLQFPHIIILKPDDFFFKFA